MIFTETVLLPKEKLDYFQGLIDGTIEWPAVTESSAPGIVYAAYADFGGGWEIDINICKGEPTPYVDAILFHEGCEVYAWDVTDRILGDWQVVLGNDIWRAFRLDVLLEED